MDQHAVELSGIGEAVPIHPFHLPRLVRIEEEVASCGAPRKRHGGAGVDDAGSGHAASNANSRNHDASCRRLLHTARRRPGLASRSLESL